jgi:feruloyl esterase
VASALFKEPGRFIPDSKYSLIHKAALAACDANDGLKDGLIGDPAKCTFDPKVIACKGEDGPDCLTAPQVEAARQIYRPVTNPRTGKKIAPSLAVGSELGWAVLGAGPGASTIITDQYRYVAFKDPNWDWKTFDFDKDIERTETPDILVMNSTDPNIAPFFSHNGKLLLYHGYSDPNITPYTTIDYYNHVTEKLGGVKSTYDSMRLFMAPGMGHCGGGEGPNKFDAVSALEQWVEKGVAPEKMIASHETNGKVDRTRPLCPYPQVAKYKGSGSVDDAANFTCAVP